MAPKRKARSGASASGDDTAKSSALKKAKKEPTVKEEDSEEKPQLKKIVVKGKAPVDPECKAKISCAHVYCQGPDIYDAMLNQTNMQFNNNKYYLLQLLEDDSSKNYSVWFRWGRVGKVGQNKLESHGGNLTKAIASFCSKFQDKTKNDWSERKDFVKVPGKYDLLEMDYSGKDDKEKKNDSKPKVKKEAVVSKLPSQTQDLLNMICDIQVMEDAVLEMKYDARKAPLGRLTKQQIKAGYTALKTIAGCIKKGGKNTGGLLQACNDFYTRIPHDFGMKVPPMIKTPQEVKTKLELLEALADIEIAMSIIQAPETNENPIDRNYKSLNCEIDPLASNTDDFKMISDYLQNTHASTHNHYKLELLEVFTISKPYERDHFNDVGNKMLLWHGSRMSNWMGILSQGLRIAPPEAPSTGYMFGKGVYFADISSKSCNYIYPTRAKNVGIVMLSEVSLGNCNELKHCDYSAHKLPAGKHSVKGLGSVVPDPSKNKVIDGGVVVPLGKPKDSGSASASGYSLNYNEYIVYDVHQIKSRFLVKVKFHFK